jgi:hypothetical protein
MERKMTDLEQRLATSHKALARKLAEALQSLTAQEAHQDARVAATLRGLSIELSDIRERLMALLGPQTVH